MIISVDTTKDTPEDLRAAAKLILEFAQGKGAPVGHPFPPEHSEHHELSREQMPVIEILDEPEPEVAAEEVAPEPAPRKTEAAKQKPEGPVVPRMPPGVHLY